MNEHIIMINKLNYLMRQAQQEDQQEQSEEVPVKNEGDLDSVQHSDEEMEQEDDQDSSEMEVVYAKNDDFILAEGAEGSEQPIVKKPKKKKKVKKIVKQNDIVQRAQLYLTKQQNKSQSVLRKVERKEKPITETKKPEKKINGPSFKQEQVYEKIEDDPKIIEESLSENSEEAEEILIDQLHNKRKYKIYSDVMADLDSKNIGRPNTASLLIPDKETKRNKSKNNNTLANFQIYQKKPKVQNQDLIELGFFEEKEERSPRKKRNPYGSSFKKEVVKKEEIVKKSVVVPPKLTEVQSLQAIDFPKKPKFSEPSPGKLKKQLTRKFLISTPPRVESEEPKNIFESSDKKPKNLLEESKKQATKKSQMESVQRLSANLGIRKKVIEITPQQPETRIKKMEPTVPIICQTISVQPFIRRAVQKMGWQETTSENKFHVKFDVADIDVKVKPNQFYNHFPDNRQITTKSGLAKNLWTNCQFESTLQISQIFPRCYDISDIKQVESFIEDYEETAILSIIKIYASKYALEPDINQFIRDYEKKSEFQNPKVYLKQYDERCKQYDKSRVPIFTNDPLKYAYTYGQNMIDQIKNIKKQPKLNEEVIQGLIAFHERSQENEQLENYNISIIEKVRIVRLHRKLEEQIPQYSRIDGQTNTWVIKPSYNARGIGIYLTKKLKDIINLGKKSQSKVVQKYIEKPYLINGKKFDVRQWVLVTSWDPLEIYVFETAYLKFCSKSFDLNDLSDNLRHLANYSIQKGQDVDDDLVWSTQDFEKHIGLDYCWNTNMLPNIQDIVYRTLKCTQQSQIDSQMSNCFEIYGFDLLLDLELNPWVIEINLSPACSERKSWLTKMLDDMALGVMEWLERKILINTNDQWNEKLRRKREKYSRQRYENLKTLNNEEFYEKNEIAFKWVKCEQCLDEINQFQQADFVNLQPQLELFGLKADLKLEKKLESNHRKKQAVLLIQRSWRGHHGRFLAKNRRILLATIILQKNFRMFLAKILLKSLKLQKCITLLQTYGRRILAKRRVEQMAAERIYFAKKNVAVKIQGHYRRKKAQKLLSEMKVNKKAEMVQRYMKGYVVKKKCLVQLYVKTMIIRLQLFFKKRYNSKLISAILIKRFLKGYRAFKKCKKLKKMKIAFKICKIMIELKLKMSYMKHLYLNAKIVQIQCRLRKYLAIKKVEKKRANKAKKKLQIMFYKHYNKITLRRSLNSMRYLLFYKARLIQKVLKNYRYRTKVSQLKIAYNQHLNTILIQKYLKGFQTSKKVKNLIALRKYSALKILSFLRMVKPRKIFKKEYQKILKAKQDKEKAIQNLNNYLSKIKSDDGDVQKIETDIHTFIEQKPVQNSRTTAVNKYFKVQPPIQPPKKSKREKTQAEKNIKDLEEQFYGRKKEKTQENPLASLPSCLPEVKIKQKIAPAMSKRSTNKYLQNPQIISSTRNPKISFAENLKLLLENQNKNERKKVEVQHEFFEELRTSSLSIVKRSSNVGIPTPQNIEPITFSDFDEISCQQISVSDINQRPIKDPRSLALLNIESKSTIAKNEFEPEDTMVRNALLEKMNNGVRQRSVGSLHSRGTMKSSKSTHMVSTQQKEQQNMQIKSQLSQLMRQKAEINYKNPFHKPPTKKKGTPSHNQIVIL